MTMMTGVWESFMIRSVICSLSFFALNCQYLHAEIPTESDDRLSVIGKPISLEVLPAAMTLSGPRANQQVLVTGVYADGSVRDLTSLSEWAASSPELLAITSTGLANGRRDGATNLDIRVANLSARVPVTVNGSSQPRPVSFRREFMPLLSVAGCSDIRCHGAPSGKNEFRLSLWGFDSVSGVSIRTWIFGSSRTTGWADARTRLFRTRVSFCPRH